MSRVDVVMKALEVEREDAEKIFGSTIFLDLWVKVKEDWRNRAGLIHTFGLD